MPTHPAPRYLDGTSLLSKQTSALWRLRTPEAAAEMIIVVKKLLLVVVLLAVPACSDPLPETSEARPSPSEASPSMSSSPAPEPLCANQAEAIAEPQLRRGGTLNGDVDGDGSDEVIAIAVDEEGDPGCTGFLVVESEAGTVATPIDEPEDGGSARFFNLRSVGAIDERPGLEIVVNALAGASTEFVIVFSAPDGIPQMMTIDGGSYGNMFPSGGSVGHIEATDCVDPGEVVVSEALPRGDGYEIMRRFFSTDGGVFAVSDREKVIIDDPQDLESFQEFVGTPFGGCSGLASG